MQKNRIVTVAIVISIGLAISAYILGNALKNRNNNTEVVVVTGMAEQNFQSDLIVWNTSFNVKKNDLTVAYSELKNQNQIIQKFLTSKGIESNEITVSAININKEYKYIYQNNVSSQYFDGYSLTQNISITSNNVEKIEKISRQVTELINQGIEINSFAPEYFYTKLSLLKMSMLAEASKDSYERAKTIAKNGGGKLGKMVKSTMGVFQITAQNSTEDYSWGGTFNTSSKLKTATVTVKSKYILK